MTLKEEALLRSSWESLRSLKPVHSQDEYEQFTYKNSPIKVPSSSGFRKTLNTSFA